MALVPESPHAESLILAIGDWVLVQEKGIMGENVREDRVPYCAKVTSTQETGAISGSGWYININVRYHKYAGRYQTPMSAVGYKGERAINETEIVAKIPSELISNYDHRVIQFFAALHGVDRWKEM